MALSSVLLLAHVVGLALGVGAATVKLVLLLACMRDDGLVPSYLRVASPITRLIVVGLALLSLSGAAWLVAGHPFTPLLAGKLALVIGVWVLGPIIDKVAEPRFRVLAQARGERPSAEYKAVRTRYVALEALATGLFYGATVVGVLL